jgi:hypothetical protein
MPAKTGLILALTCLTRQIQSGMTPSREVASAEGLAFPNIKILYLADKFPSPH